MLQTITLINKIYLLIAIISLCLFLPKIVFIVLGMFSQKPFKTSSVMHKIAIVIPARFESKVIRGLLDSIKKQTYDKNYLDTFVIVPESSDPTVEIVKEYANTYLHILDHKVSSKGETMDSLFKLMLQNDIEKYDAFFIVDADNILDEKCLYHINNAFSLGYDVVLAGRQNKNWEDGWISNCSALTFSFVNGLNNKARTKLGANILISGSGLLISKDIIKENKGWPWQSLTEDYEFSQVAFIKDYKTCYYELANFFDEQPSNLKQSKTQLTRWLKGHFYVKKKYKNEMYTTLFKTKKASKRFFMLDFMFSLVPLIIMLVSTFLYIALNVGILIASLILKSSVWLVALNNILITIVVAWLLFMLYSLLGLICDRKNIKMDLKNCIITLIMSPIYFFRFLPIFINSLFIKNLAWERIDHNKTSNNEKG